MSSPFQAAGRRARLLLVRHGETDDNKNLVFQGQEGAELNARGRDQAARLGARLARASVRPAALYTSDLARARETAEIVGRALGLEPVLDEGLREIYLGAWQGLSHTEIAQRFPDEWAAWRAGDDIRRGGGETYAELDARMARSMDRIAAAHAGAAALVVSHGAALKTFAGHVLGMRPGCATWLRSFRVQENTAVSVVDRDAEGYRIVAWNDAAHLHDAVLEALGGPA
jgi:probable phosphoglycerate mutase